MGKRTLQSTMTVIHRQIVYKPKRLDARIMTIMERTIASITSIREIWDPMIIRVIMVMLAAKSPTR
jgi:hypothetical protein